MSCRFLLVSDKLTDNVTNRIRTEYNVTAAKVRQTVRRDIMNEYNYNCGDGVPIKAERVFDSCSDKDCFENLPVTLSGGELPDNINILRSRSAAVENVSISVEPVPFNRGFYQIDITFTFSLEILGYESSCSSPEVFTGTCYASKSCILYGSEASARTFTSGGCSAEGASAPCCADMNLPTASVSVLEPIVLETKADGGGCCGKRPSHDRGVNVTMGLFSVTELSRPVTIMVPAMEYNIPKKECCGDSESPCEIFGRLRFPDEEFKPLAIGNAVKDEEAVPPDSD